MAYEISVCYKDFRRAEESFEAGDFNVADGWLFLTWPSGDILAINLAGVLTYQITEGDVDDNAEGPDSNAPGEFAQGETFFHPPSAQYPS